MAIIDKKFNAQIFIKKKKKILFTIILKQNMANIIINT